MKTACEKGDFEKVFELIKAGQDPRHAMSGKKKNESLSTMLHSMVARRW